MEPNKELLSFFFFLGLLQDVPMIILGKETALGFGAFSFVVR